MDRPLLHQTRNPPGSLDSSACQRERSTVQSVGHLAGPDTAKPVSATALPRTSPPAPAPNTSTRAPPCPSPPSTSQATPQGHVSKKKKRRRAMGVGDMVETEATANWWRPQKRWSPVVPRAPPVQPDAPRWGPSSSHVGQRSLGAPQQG